MKPSVLLSKTGTVLLVIDVQDKFIPVIPRFGDLADNMTRLILAFQMYDMPIIVTEQYPDGLGQTVERLRKLFTFLEVVEKTEFSATDNPHFWAQVNVLKPSTFVVCGIETHVCISQTVIKLLEKGMQVHVVADATGSRRPLDYNVALRKMEIAGAHIATTEMCLFELAEKAGTETFKYIQRMVKNKPSSAVSVRPNLVAGPSKLKEPGKRADIANASQSEEIPATTKRQEKHAAIKTEALAVADDAVEKPPSPLKIPADNSAMTAADTEAKESEIAMKEIDKIVGDIDKLTTDK